MKKILKIAVIILLIIIIGIAGIGVYIKTALPNVGPPPHLTVNITPERIERGKYLANNVAVCMDCHSHRDWSVYAGPLIPETFGGGGERFGKEFGFPGTIYSKNITPFALHDWTDGEIFRTITTGVDKNGDALFPLMPYASFNQMDSEDLYSIIAYLRSIPSVKNEVAERSLDFPVNFIVNTLPKKYAPQPRPDTTDRVAYGKYLVTMASCVECHCKVNKGTRIPGTEFGGGREFPFPNGTVATSANITPDMQSGIGSWDERTFVARFRQYSGGATQKIAAADFNTMMPWAMYGKMTDNDLSAIYAYLRTLKPISNTVQKFARK